MRSPLLFISAAEKSLTNTARCTLTCSRSCWKETPSVRWYSDLIAVAALSKYEQPGDISPTAAGCADIFAHCHWLALSLRGLLQVLVSGVESVVSDAVAALDLGRVFEGSVWSTCRIVPTNGGRRLDALARSLGQDRPATHRLVADPRTVHKDRRCWRSIFSQSFLFALLAAHRRPATRQRRNVLSREQDIDRSRGCLRSAGLR